MDYTILTLEDRLEMLRGRLHQYEANFYNQETEAKAAVAMGLAEVAETAAKARDEFERAVIWTREEIKALEAQA